MVSLSHKKTEVVYDTQNLIVQVSIELNKI